MQQSGGQARSEILRIEIKIARQRREKAECRRVIRRDGNSGPVRRLFSVFGFGMTASIPLAFKTMDAFLIADFGAAAAAADAAVLAETGIVRRQS